MDRKERIAELLPKLAQARKDDLDATTRMKTALDEFMASDDVYRINKDWHDTSKVEVEQLEKEIRNLALDAYAVDGEKKINSFVEIKIFKTFKIIDTKKVFDWAWKNLPAAFKIDEAKIKKYALDFGDVEGTEKGEEARAQIATSL